ncbi:tetratricopeptide repeat protein [Paracoccus yeei]|uniref:tetratricopeptide repeat protein n=1 Tax=Paracoccus yeei TaxID=147645 RepID=UPI0037CD2E94
MPADGPPTAWEGWRPADPGLAHAFDLWRAGRLDAAEAAFRARLAGEDAWRGLGSVLWTQGRMAEAHEAFAVAIRLGPRRAMNLGNLGLVLRDLRRFAPALAAFDVALGLDPAYEPAWNEAANVLYDMGRPAKALPLYRRALALDARRAVVHHNLGMCLTVLGRRNEARAAFRHALSLDPAYAWSRDMLRRLERSR